MESLNKIIEEYFRFNARDFDRIKLVKDFEKKLPRKYNPEDNDYWTIYKSIGQLDLELIDAENGEFNILFQTKLENNLQVLNIFRNGKWIPEKDLQWINDKLDKIYNGEIKETQYMNGYLNAGQMIKELNGRIYLEKLIKNKYYVKTTVEIPD